MLRQSHDIYRFKTFLPSLLLGIISLFLKLKVDMVSQVLERNNHEPLGNKNEDIETTVESEIGEVDREKKFTELDDDEVLISEDDDAEETFKEENKVESDSEMKEGNISFDIEADLEDEEDLVEENAAKEEIEQEVEQEKYSDEQCETEKEVALGATSSLIDSDDDDIENLEAEMEKDKEEVENGIDRSSDYTNTNFDSRQREVSYELVDEYSSQNDDETVAEERNGVYEDSNTPYIELLSEEEIEMTSPNVNLESKEDTDERSQSADKSEKAYELVELVADSEDEGDGDRDIYSSENGGQDENGSSVPVIIKIDDIDFLLLPYNGGDKSDLSHMVTLFDDARILKSSVEEFFSTIRANEDLKEVRNFEINQELILEIPELGGLYITEDNIYSRDIMIDDFVRAFINLTENSQNETDVPSNISFHLSTQNRFVTNFNYVSELIRAGKGFDDLKELRLNSNKKKRDHETEDDSLNQNGEKKRKIVSSV